MAQVNITLTVPDNKQAAVLDAFCAKYGWTEDSGLTKVQFLKQEVAEFLKTPYMEAKFATEATNARNTALQDINSFDIT